jgi:hypothetical protein
MARTNESWKFGVRPLFFQYSIVIHAQAPPFIFLRLEFCISLGKQASKQAALVIKNC